MNVKKPDQAFSNILLFGFWFKKFGQGKVKEYPGRYNILSKIWPATSNDISDFFSVKWTHPDVQFSKPISLTENKLLAFSDPIPDHTPDPTNWIYH